MANLIEKPYHFAVVIEESYGGRGLKQYLEVSALYQVEKREIEEIRYRVMFDLTDPLARWTSRPLDYISPEALDTAEKHLRKMINVDVPAEIEKGKRSLAYRQMKKQAEKIGWPRLWETDLTFSDARIIGREKPKSFVWILREYGTHIILYNTNQAKDFVEAVEESSLFFVYRNRRLIEVDKSEAIKALKELPRRR